VVLIVQIVVIARDMTVFTPDRIFFDTCCAQLI